MILMRAELTCVTVRTAITGRYHVWHRALGLVSEHLRFPTTFGAYTIYQLHSAPL